MQGFFPSFCVELSDFFGCLSTGENHFARRFLQNCRTLIAQKVISTDLDTREGLILLDYQDRLLPKLEMMIGDRSRFVKVVEIPISESIVHHIPVRR